ncbi:NUDIX domain-containing protein [Algoriphagus sp. PAP.12]|uniref:NUDIX domain-containing protein n=1 Tax=Algoriphagus sp. PAP.12 TaxID=2996678 RepID=UPI00227D2D50|nr:NUDIX domain-containing protein [Algoriphagus sp. PAP.12]
MKQDKIGNEINAKFGNHLRTRVNGVFILEDKILMIRHLMGDQKEFWSVPGGGMDYGTSAKINLKREFQEETGLEIEVGNFLFVHEFFRPPLHSMELFFEVSYISGEIALGTDPELDKDNQIMTDIAWMNISDIRSLPRESVHQIFWDIKSLQELGLCKGYFNFENNYLK